MSPQTPTIKDVLQGIGALQEGQKRVDDRLKSLEGKIEAIQKSHRENTTQIALINQRCVEREKRITELYDRIRLGEMSGVTQVVQKDTAIKLMKWKRRLLPNVSWVMKSVNQVQFL